ncbi:hypothetical protein [Chryseobacterium tongliaoense]|uniref:hypothetical protein n=1 Tax=Chryseobacterium tongliaoense TaxID=3240933 RepID=UPI003517EE97
MNLSEYHNIIKKYSKDIDDRKRFTPNEYLIIGKLWNTICYYAKLQSTNDGKKFYRLVRDVLIPEMIKALDMTVSRGYSFYSEKYDFTLGGILEERFRFIIEDIEID